MRGFRKVYVCEHCGKVYRSDYFILMRECVCRRCGSTMVWSHIRKPILFGLKGWKKPDYGYGRNKTYNK